MSPQKDRGLAASASAINTGIAFCVRKVALCARAFVRSIYQNGDLNEHGCMLAGLIVIALFLANLGGASWPN